MNIIPAFNADKVNIVLMIMSCIIAFMVPFEMVLLSYAFLGPAHYLTQISWMHDRHFFNTQKGDWISGIVLTGLILAAVYFPFMGGNKTIYMLYALAISSATVAIFVKSLWQKLLIGAFLMGGFLVLSGIYPNIVRGLIILLPTAVHIYVFTGCFILYGALKNRSSWGKASFVIYVLCGASFLFFKPAGTMIAPAFVSNNISLFDKVAAYLADLLSFNGWISGRAMLGFLAFAYTYHYLNWFSKVNIIKWDDMPKKRALLLAALYFCSIGLYLYNYATGFVALLFLSILHVIMELPLNVLTIKNLAQMGAQAVMPSRARPES